MGDFRNCSSLALAFANWVINKYLVSLVRII